jgi:hypothetical protein
MEAITDGNGRVTLALIGQKLDMVIMKIDDLSACYRDHGERIALLDRKTDVHAERIKGCGDDVTALEAQVDHINTRDRWGTVGTGIAAVVAGIVAIFKP